MDPPNHHAAADGGADAVVDDDTPTRRRDGAHTNTEILPRHSQPESNKDSALAPREWDIPNNHFHHHHSNYRPTRLIEPNRCRHMPLEGAANAAAETHDGDSVPIPSIADERDDKDGFHTHL